MRLRRAVRWIKRFVVTLVALTAVLLIAVIIALHTGWGREKLRARVEAELAQTFPGGAHVGTLDGSVLGTITLRDVQVDGLDHAPLVTIGKVDVDLALLPLLVHTARIDRLRADDFRVFVHHRPASPPGPRGEPSRWDVALPDVAIHHAVLELADAGVALDDVDLHGGGFIPAGEAPRFLATVTGQWRDHARAFTAFAGVEVGERVQLPFALAVFAGGTLAATDIVVDRDQPAGAAVIRAPSETIALVAPRFALPGDGFASATASAGHLEVRAVIGDARLHAALDGSIAQRTAVGIAEASAPDLAAVTRGRVAGGGSASATFTVEPGRIAGTVTAHGDLPRVPAHDALIVFDASCNATTLYAHATGEGELDAYVAAHGNCDGDSYRVTTAHGTATAGAVTARATTVTGKLAVAADAKGSIWPLDLTVDGETHDRAVRLDELGARRVDGRLSAHVTLASTLGEAHLDLAEVKRLANPLGAAHVDIANRADGSLDVAAKGWPRAAPGVALFARGHVVPGPTTRVALGTHRITLPTGAWTGRGGTLAIASDKVALRGLVTHRGTSAVAARLDFARATAQLGVTLDIPQLAADAFDADMRGAAHGTVAVTERGGRWGGHGELAIAGFATRADALPLDGSLRIALAGRRATAAVHAENPQAGAADATLEVEAPADPIDLRAWQRIDRDAVRTARIELHGIDLAAFGRAGRIDGALDVAPRVLAGTIGVRDVATPLGTLGGDVTFAPREGDLGAHATARLADVGEVALTARFAVPQRPFDPATWRGLGRGMIREAAADLDDVTFDPKLLARFGVHEPMSGRATVELALGKAAAEAKLGIELANVTGGGLVAPVDAHVAIDAGTRGTHVDATLCARAGCTLPLGTLAGDVPMTLDRWLAEPRAILQAPLTASWKQPEVAAADVLALFGRHDLHAGTLDGNAAIRGTVTTPIVDRAELNARAVVVAPRLGGKPPPALRELGLVATWGGAAGTLTVTGRETGSGTLYARFSGRPDALAAVTGTLRTTAFDIAPIAVVLPDEVAGSAGVIDADLGLASGGRLSGTLDLAHGTVPIGASIGTLRDAVAHVQLDERTVTARAEGKLGAGTVHLEADADAAGVTTHAKLVLSKVSPIGVLQPIIDATIHGTLQRTGSAWHGDLRVSGASVTIPRRSGTRMLDTGVPSDLHIGEHAKVVAAGPRVVAHPRFVADIVVESTRISARDVVEGFGADGEASSKHLALVVGDSVTLTGVVDLVGTADVFGRTYQLGASSARFEGTFDPWLDIALSHDFPALVLTASITGPASKPVPHFSSEPGGYSESQLLGFFLGGEPGGDPSTQTSEAVASAMTSVLSARIAREFDRVLPVHVETTCQLATSTTSASCTLGHWFTPHWFVAVRPHRDPRPDENATDILGQYYFGREVLLEAQGGGPHMGGDLLWRHRW